MFLPHYAMHSTAYAVMWCPSVRHIRVLCWNK